MKAIELNNVSVHYPDDGRPGGVLRAASKVSFALETGEIGCLLGPSGCGKTSLLRAVAGFVSIAEGEILINGERMGVWACILLRKREKSEWSFRTTPSFRTSPRARTYVLGLPRDDARPQRMRYPRRATCCRLLGLKKRQSVTPMSSPAASNSGWLWPAHWHRSLPWCSWMSPSPTWTSRYVTVSPGRFGIF